MRTGARAAGLMIGIAADAAFGDPRRGHPVAGFGAVAAALERRVYRDSVGAGAGYAAVLAGGAVLGGAAVARLVRGRAAAETALVAVSTWAVLGGTSLIGEGAALAHALDDAALGDAALDDAALDDAALDAARARIPSLCARDPQLLDADGMARAGVESLAENTSDAVVGPLVWGAFAGVPGLLGYRAVNTLDAMVGYRSPRYDRFGRASARLDDVVNLLPARVTALLTVALAPAVGGSPSAALRAWRRDAAGHPSPNAGPVEATAAGALGLRLGGTTTYAHGTEERPSLGSGPAPTTADLHRAARLSRLVAGASGALAVLTAWGLGRSRVMRGVRGCLSR
ncbi:cobalamin biosynthesis protein [Pseudonocardia phyllosphaerae]|uniref:cobalamin biosynthesis protein n=1 Tax=Pseudonocardia phyllosphaerae TaxID=3390502 RepID=UPI003978E5FE